MKINPLSLAKFAASAIVGIGTGKIVGAIIKDAVKPEKLIEKITVGAASWVIAGIATEATKKYTNEMIDDVAKAVNAVVDTVKLNGKINRVNAGLSTLEEEGLNQAEFEKNDEGKWVPRTPKAITAVQAADLIDTSKWKYDFDKDIWTKKNGDAGFLKQLRLPDGSPQWVTTEDV